MNLGIISTPNTKGQIVIPKKYRDLLGIDSTTPVNIIPQNQGIFIHPLQNFSLKTKKNKSDIFSDILARTKGTWAKENWLAWQKKQSKNRKLEIESSQKNRQQTW